MNSCYERAVSTEQSLCIAKQAVSALNIRVSDEAHGVDLQTYRCKLVDDHYQSIFFGFGKGLGLQSKVSAYYEALEHYAVYRFAQITASVKDNYIASYPYEHSIPCVDLVNIHGKEQ